MGDSGDEEAIKLFQKDEGEQSEVEQDIQEDDQDEQESDKHQKRKGGKLKGGRIQKKRNDQNQYFEDQASQSNAQDENSDVSQDQLIGKQRVTLRPDFHKPRHTDLFIRKYEGKTEDQINKMVQSSRYNQYQTQETCPGIDQPKVYFVPVKKGKEDSLALAILNKASQLYPEKQKRLMICSVIAIKKKFPGYLFIEAFNEKDIKKALDGLYDISARQLEEMKSDQYPTLFKEKEVATTNIKKDDFVRIKGGLYDEDLAKVRKQKKNAVEVILVPRINIQDISAKQKQIKERFKDAESKQELEEKAKLLSRVFKRYFNHHLPVDKKSRPPKKMINDKDLPDIPQIQKLSFTTQGYIVLSFTYNEVTKQLGAITPKQFELFKKEDNLADFAKKELKNLVSTINIIKGDEVEIIHGAARGITGTVIEVKENTAVIESKMLSDRIVEEAINNLAKKFKPRQYVTVISGNDKGKSGRILKIQQGTAIIFTENQNQIKVNTNNLTLSKGSSSMMEENKQDFKRYEVIKTHQGVGMILACMKDNLKILNLSNTIQMISVLDFDSKVDTRKNFSKNSYGEIIKNGALVRIKDGLHAGKRCEVKHVYKDYLFLQNNDFYQTRGFAVERSTNCALVTPSTEFKHNKPIYGVHEIPNANPKFKTQEKDHDQLQVGKTIIIKSGLHKGYQGLITSNNGNTIAVRLTAKGKTVHVNRNEILAKEKTQQIGKTPRVSGSTYVQQSPAPYNESHHERNYDDY